jgi:hypothetical protein
LYAKIQRMKRTVLFIVINRINTPSKNPCTALVRDRHAMHGMAADRAHLRALPDAMSGVRACAFAPQL